MQRSIWVVSAPLPRFSNDPNIPGNSVKLSGTNSTALVTWQLLVEWRSRVIHKCNNLHCNKYLRDDPDVHSLVAQNDSKNPAQPNQKNDVWAQLRYLLSATKQNHANLRKIESHNSDPIKKNDKNGRTWKKNELKIFNKLLRLSIKYKTQCQFL